MTEAALRAQPHFRRYLAARAVSVAGTLLTAVVLPVLVYRLTSSAAWTAAIAAVQALPHLLFALPAGVLAERMDRRRLMAGADVAAAAVLASIPVAWLADASSEWHVLGVAFAAQALFVLADAADHRALPTMVGREGEETARCAASGTTRLAELMVPALAGLAVAIVAPAPLLALGAMTAVASALLVRAVGRPLSPSPQPGRPAARVELRAALARGLGVLRSRRSVRVMTLAGVTHAVVGGAWAAMLLPWADVVLGVAPTGDARLALLVSCWGIGGLIAGGLVPLLRRRLGPIRLARAALPASLACGLGVLACTHWLPAVLVGTLWGTAYWVVVGNAVAYRHAVAPEALRWRVEECARMLARGVGFPAGAALAGAVATVAGPRAGLAAPLAVLLLGVLLVWRPLQAPRGAVDGAEATGP